MGIIVYKVNLDFNYPNQCAFTSGLSAAQRVLISGSTVTILDGGCHNLLFNPLIAKMIFITFECTTVYNA